MAYIMLADNLLDTHFIANLHRLDSPACPPGWAG
jgi:hypothetical protein